MQIPVEPDTVSLSGLASRRAVRASAAQGRPGFSLGVSAVHIVSTVPSRIPWRSKNSRVPSQYSDSSTLTDVVPTGIRGRPSDKLRICLARHTPMQNIKHIPHEGWNAHQPVVECLACRHIDATDQVTNTTLVDRKLFLMHVMVGNVVDGYGTECARADMQIHVRELESLHFELVDELIREMQPCVTRKASSWRIRLTWSRHAALALREDSLVKLLVLLIHLAMHVWRQRDGTVALEGICEHHHVCAV
eukprot:scaffold795_cov375-Prasinococcus_capsulatus_cf.AAC.12